MLDTSNLETNISNFFSNGKDDKMIYILQEKKSTIIYIHIHTYICIYKCNTYTYVYINKYNTYMCIHMYINIYKEAKEIIGLVFAESCSYSKRRNK